MLYLLTILLAVAAVYAAVLTYVFLASKASLGRELDAANEKLAAAQTQCAALSGRLDELRGDVSAAEVSAAVSRSEKDGALARLEESAKKLSELSRRAEEAEKTVAARDSEREVLERTLAQTQERYAELRKKLDSDFQILANKIFESARRKFVDEGGEKISAMLNPLAENIREFRKRVDDVHDAQTKASAGVSVQIESLLKMNDKLSKDAENLASALRSNNKAAGNWGEAVLERIFESCGLIKGIHYRAQTSFSDSTTAQSRLVPDFIVDLPDNRSIIVDSKISLVDYVDYCAAPDAAAKRESLEKFKKSVRAHLKEFAQKYDSISSLAGFKMMFMPVEPAYNLAIETDKPLLADAYRDNVIIVSPVSVMAILKFAQIAYRNDAVSKNVAELSKLGRLLGERIERFLKRFNAIQDRINALQKEYSDTKMSLSDGTQSVSNTARRFHELSQKSLEKQIQSDVKTIETEAADEKEQ